MIEKVRIHDSFWLLIAVVFLLDPNYTFLYFLLAAAVHELGHFSMIALYRGTVTQFDISAAGGFMQYHLPKLSAASDIWIALGGPAAGFLLWLIAGFFHWELLSGASLLLSVFNLLPIAPLDGGKAIESLFPPGHLIPQVLAILFSFVILLFGIYVGFRHNGWGLCFVGLLLMLEHRIDLQSIYSQSKI